MRRNANHALIILIIFFFSQYVSAEEGESLENIFICDLREVFGTCKEYNSSKLDSEAEQFYRESCARNKYGDNIGKYYNNRRCPSEKRIGSCLNADPYLGKFGNGWRNDKHYYNGTSKDYPWKVEGFKSACSKSGGELRVY